MPEGYEKVEDIKIRHLNKDFSRKNGFGKREIDRRVMPGKELYSHGDTKV